MWQPTGHRINKSSTPLPAPNLRAECTRVNKTKDMFYMPEMAPMTLKLATSGWEAAASPRSK